MTLDLHKEELHPDIKNQPEFEKKVIDILIQRRREREEARDPNKKKARKVMNFLNTAGKITKEEKDHEYSMARSEIHKIDNAIKTLRKKLKGEGNLEAWVQSKITRAADYLDAASNYVDSGEHNGQVDESFDDGPELRSRTVTDAPSSSRSSTRRGRKSPGELMRMLNQDTPSVSKPKKKKKKTTVAEETMTAEQKAKEEELKKKYDDSDMKQNMIDQYGKEKGTQIYFAKIRKMAMQEEFIDPEEGETPSGRKPIEKVAEHPNPKVRRRAVEGMRKQMEKEYGGKWKTRSKDPAIEEETSSLTKPTKEQKRRLMLLQKLEKMVKAANASSYQSDVAKEDVTYDEYLDEAKLSRTARRSARAGKPGYDAEGKPKPKGKVRAWDMDETLMRNDPKKIRVHVKDKEGKPVQSLTNQEFNVHKLDKDKGHSYDFGEFRSSEKFSKASTPNKSMIKKLKKQVRRGKPVHIVTARGSFDDQPKFAKHLRKHGIEIDPGKGKGGRHVHVHRAGDMPGSDIGQKKVDIVKGLMKKHETSGAEMYDDAAKVHRAFKKSGLKVKTQMVQPNKKDVTQARPFREDFDDELLYDFLLEQLVLEEIAESYEDASIIIDNLNDELLEDLVYQGYEFIHSVLEEETIMQEEMRPRIDYISPYKKIQEKREIKKDYLSEELELTPYEYWKSFIGDEETEEVVSEELDENEVMEEVEMTSYEKWKRVLEEV